MQTERQFTLRQLFAWILCISIAIGLAAALLRWGKELGMQVEREAARERVAKTGRETEYDRKLLGDEVDTLKSKFQKKRDSTTKSIQSQAP